MNLLIGSSQRVWEWPVGAAQKRCASSPFPVLHLALRNHAHAAARALNKGQQEDVRIPTGDYLKAGHKVGSGYLEGRLKVVAR